METDIKLLYDDLYNQADKVLKKYNPCKIDGDQCRRCGPYTEHMQNLTGMLCGLSRNPCCNACPHLCKEEGCTVKSLGCKLHICEDMRKFVDKECLKELLTIQQEAVNNNIPLIGRASKEETFSTLRPGHCFILDERYWRWDIK